MIPDAAWHACYIELKIKPMVADPAVLSLYGLEAIKSQGMKGSTKPWRSEPWHKLEVMETDDSWIG